MAICEALRATYDSEWINDVTLTHYNVNRPVPNRITVEYADEEQDWPFILVQISPSVVQWTGITPDEVFETGDPNFPLVKVREGYFEATVMLSIYALSSESRDRMYDNMLKVVMMGRKNAATKDFFTSLENQDLIGMTVMEAEVSPVGDSISVGTPWNSEQIAYEASVQFQVIGRFYAPEYDEQLIALSGARVFPYTDQDVANNQVPWQNDGHGAWTDAWS